MARVCAAIVCDAKVNAQTCEMCIFISKTFLPYDDSAIDFDIVDIRIASAAAVAAEMGRTRRITRLPIAKHIARNRKTSERTFCDCLLFSRDSART